MSLPLLLPSLPPLPTAFATQEKNLNGGDYAFIYNFL